MRTRPLSDMLGCVAKHCVASANMYYVMSDADVQQAIDRRGAKAHVAPAPGLKLSYKDTLPEYEKVHLEVYEDLWRQGVAKGRFDKTAEYIVDTRHNPDKHKRCGPILGSLTTTSHRYSFTEQRCLLGPEMFAAVGAPTQPILDALEERYTKMGDLVAAEQIRVCWMAPSVLAEVLPASATSLCGNGFSLPCGASVVAWVFGTCVPVSVNAMGQHIPAIELDRFAAATTCADDSEDVSTTTMRCVNNSTGTRRFCPDADVNSKRRRVMKRAYSL